MENLANELRAIQMSNEAKYLNIVVSFFLCFASSLVIKYLYEKKSNSLTSISAFSRLLPVLSLITFLVIMIVKSSLALSLGLVGALSISITCDCAPSIAAGAETIWLPGTMPATTRVTAATAAATFNLRCSRPKILWQVLRSESRSLLRIERSSNLFNSITGAIAVGIDAGIPGDTQENQRNQVSEEDRANLDLVKAFENGSVSVEAKNKALDDLAAAGIIHKNGLIVQTPTIDDNGNVIKDPVTAEEENLKRPKSRNALGGGMSSGEASLVGEFGPETFVAGMDGAIIPNMKAMLNRMPDIAKTMQDEMAMMGAPISKVAQEASAQMQNSTSVEQKLDILNQTMLQLVSINSVQARTGEKQLRGSRHVGNLMGGLGRA